MVFNVLTLGCYRVYRVKFGIRVHVFEEPYRITKVGQVIDARKAAFNSAGILSSDGYRKIHTHNTIRQKHMSVSLNGTFTIITSLGGGSLGSDMQLLSQWKLPPHVIMVKCITLMRAPKTHGRQLTLSITPKCSALI